MCPGAAQIRSRDRRIPGEALASAGEPWDKEKVNFNGYSNSKDRTKSILRAQRDLTPPGSLGVKQTAEPSQREAQREALAAERERQQEELTVKLMGLVKRVAFEMREHLPAHLDLDDLVSAGSLGLIDAVRRFEASKHVKIETYARYRIRGAILDALRSLDPASRDMRKKNKRAERVFRELQAKLGRPATDSEMAEAMHMSLNSWYKMVSEMQCMGVEWLRPTDMAPSHPLAEEDLPATEQADQFELCYRQEQRDLIARSLERVSERERLVLSLYYLNPAHSARLEVECGFVIKVQKAHFIVSA